MAGKKTQSTTPNLLAGINIQSSIAGSVIPRGWGTFRVAANLLWYGDFAAVSSTTTTGGGKGGTPSNSTTTYSYTAAVIMGICQGPIAGVTTIYKDQSVFADNTGQGSALQQTGLSVADGSLAQAPWGYLDTNHPDQSIGYSGIAYAYAPTYSLGTSGQLGNHSFEVVSELRYGGTPDALPSDIINDFLPSLPFWTTGLIGDLTDWGGYCSALGLLLSPVLDQQRTAGDFLQEILQATNSNCVWAGGQLKFFTYGDTEVNGWVPNLTPEYDLTDDDFIPKSTGAEPVLSDNTRAADAYNYVQVEYLDRDSAYSTQIAPGTDSANIDQYGRLQNPSPYSIHSICDSNIAGQIAQLIVQRACNVRTTYTFTLPGNFDLLEAGVDLVTITSGKLDHVLVRLTAIKENPDGSLDCTAEEMLVGTAHAAAYSVPGGGGYVVNRNVDPGATNESALINPNRTLTNGDYELWLAASGTSASWGGAEIWASWDGASYGLFGRIDTRGRFGIVAHYLADTPDPDTVDTLSVDVSATAGVLLPGSQADADNAVTLCLVGDELISYAEADLTGAYAYDLSYLRRGWYDSTITEHVIGDPFIRLDGAIAKIAYDPAKVGATLHIKFRSFNVFGLALQDLSVATDHVVILNPGAPPIIDITSTDTQNVAGRPSSLVLAQIDDVIVGLEVQAQQAQALTDEVNTQAMALLQQVMNSINLKTYADALLWIGQGSVKTAVLNEVINRIDGDTAIVETISIIGAKSTDGLSFILNDATVQVSPGLALGTYISTVSSSLSGNAAAITSEATTRATADTATATLIGLVGAQNGGGTAFVFNSTTAQVSPGLSLGSYISGVSSSISGVSASVTSEASTRASADSTIASNLSTVSTTVSGHTASISTLSSSVSGIMASWGVSVDVNGNVGGIRLVGTSTTSYLGIIASSLYFVDSAATLYSPFYITGGVTYADSLVVRLLRAGTIITDHIQNNQVTIPSFVAAGNASGAGYGNVFTICSEYVTLTSDGWIYAHASFQMGFSSGNQSWNWSLWINGGQYNGGGGTVVTASVSGPAAVSLTAGTYLVELQWSGDGTITAETPSLFCMGVMK